ncbi:hypothetical protein OG225_40330 (plasmid) [Nocardia sp. NBC_01377]|uniref:hypothetical protein n=1 Tax=Nocardia sp. NBC_01377 TaxID=2903595 RepID=UPI002F91348B
MEHNRIQLAPLDDSVPDREVFVGWDRALGTYFVQVFDGRDRAGEDIVRVDLGNEFGEITTPAQAIDAVRPYAQISETLADVLDQQRNATVSLQRSPFESWARASFLPQSRAAVDTPDVDFGSGLIEAAGLADGRPIRPATGIDRTTADSAAPIQAPDVGPDL